MKNTDSGRRGFTVDDLYEKDVIDAFVDCILAFCRSDDPNRNKHQNEGMNIYGKIGLVVAAVMISIVGILVYLDMHGGY